jgi:3-deoxy-manno-octulosonate cytidylyltransferase (CMP-KDO synthetase)
MKYSDTAIFIPARYGSTRLRGKSLMDINGKPMVVRVMEIAKNSNLCDVVVATESNDVVDVVEKFGGIAVLTDANLQSGTDRIYQALERVGKKYDYVINLQGDMPNIDVKIIADICEAVRENVADIITAVYKIKDNSWRGKPQCVKAVITNVNNEKYHRCLYFSRANVPTGEGDAYAHLGIYGYTYVSLKKFVNLVPSPLEKSEKLEQLRALENGMSISAIIANSFPISVDVVEDLEEARRVIK